MSEQTLLIVVIGILALSWLMVAVVLALVGVRVYRILGEFELMAQGVRDKLSFLFRRRSKKTLE